MGIPDKMVSRAFSVLSRAAEDHSVWIVGFSGGKDSSVLVDLVLRFVEREGRPEKVYILYSDTLLEPPPLRGYAVGVVHAVDGILEGVRGFVVTPLDTGTDIVEMVIVKGYPAPSPRFRWCTDRWKLQPPKKLLEKLGLQRGYAVLTGVRAEEAAHRARRLRGADLQEALGGKPYMPLLEWRVSHVWEYIRSRRPYWQVPDWSILEKLYGGENTIRTGCWMCTIIARDRAWEKLAATGLVDKRLYMLTMTWRSLYIHFSRIRPDLWRLKRRKKGRWRFNYGKLKPEARLALADCLEAILQHPEYPPDASKPLLEKLGRVLEKLEERRESLEALLREDTQAEKLYNSCRQSHV